MVCRRVYQLFLLALIIAFSSSAFLPFCNQAGAVVDNSWKIQDYVDTVKVSLAISQSCFKRLTCLIIVRRQGQKAQDL
jgi:hypothetical protein